MSGIDYLSPILERKHLEVARRCRHEQHFSAEERPVIASRANFAAFTLRRPRGAPARVIAEIKRRSPSAGMLRARAHGDVAWLAHEYLRGGADSISVLCDRQGFDGSALDVRRVALEVSVPILFKEFVLDESQVRLAQRMGAHMILLLVRALSAERLHALCTSARRQGMAPIVEAADDREVQVALATEAKIIGVNARNLHTFEVDCGRAEAAMQRIPADRIAVHMSGVHSAGDYQRVCAGRADAVLIGESLMRADRPSSKLRELLSQ